MSTRQYSAADSKQSRILARKFVPYQKKLFHALVGQVASSTIQVYLGSGRQLFEFCQQRGAHFMPVSETTLVQFIEQQSRSQKYGSLKSKLQNIKALHKHLGYQNPAGSKVRRLMNTLARQKGAGQAQAHHARRPMCGQRVSRS